MMTIVQVDMDDDAGYGLTKAYWKNLEAMMNANVLMGSINPNVAFSEMNAPLHAGAARYYESTGIEIPDAIKPK